ncbi:hypothetical protein ABZ281_08685 [Streptomyces sp. NPDC006265]|uniref:hypothetical protein n=1 Tax=Streptomyces sp. NPDC006265 TaxID=3156740 RepID=UPI0033A1AE78
MSATSATSSCTPQPSPGTIWQNWASSSSGARSPTTSPDLATTGPPGSLTSSPAGPGRLSPSWTCGSTAAAWTHGPARHRACCATSARQAALGTLPSPRWITCHGTLSTDVRYPHPHAQRLRELTEQTPAQRELIEMSYAHAVAKASTIPS